MSIENKTALVIGGSKGFGLSVTNVLTEHKFHVATIGRNPAPDLKHHFICDVSDLKNLRETLLKIQVGFYHLDLVACVVGYGRSEKQFSAEDWVKHMCQNFMYVDVAFRQLWSPLRYADKPIGITIGSRYSHSGTDFGFMLPYICAKYALRGLTHDLSMRFPRLSINNFCVVPMNTPGRAEVYKQMPGVDSPAELLAAPEQVARGMIAFALEAKFRGQTFIVNHNGSVFPIEEMTMAHSPQL